MAKRTYTESQRSAIDTRDKTLLVSAAAGSGKTATLIERIVQSVLDPEHPTDINKMLIVTFTKAAAAELRAKVTDALCERLETEPDNARLERQIHLLPSASISTIDAFCNSILKNNTEIFGVSPRYRIADPIESEILSHSVWSELIEAAYAGELSDIVSAEAFNELAETVTSVKSNSGLEEIFDGLYEHSKSHESGVAVFRGFAEALKAELNLPIEESKYVKFAVRRLHEISEGYEKLYSALLMKLPEEENGKAVLEWMLGELRLACAASSYSEIREHVNAAAGKPPISDKKIAETAPELIACKADLKDAVQMCSARYFKFTEAQWRAQMKKLSGLLSSLAALIEKFDEVFFEEKRERAILEYSDIERLTYKSLYNPDGTLTDFALALRGEYEAVYIDEYQDVNALQNKIFEAISTDTNRFMVGDIKQSIYVFRSARPDIFAKMKGDFPPLCEAEGSDNASIFMSENFRCDEVIVDFVNSVFDTCFTLFGDSIGYVDGDRLKYSKKQSTAAERILPELHIFTKEEDEEAACDCDEEPEEKEKSPSPIWVAAKIKELCETATLNSGEPVRPRDIAIILRYGSGRSKAYSDALEELGIPARAPDDRSFFLNAEIQLALCLLCTIDNPRRDIYLAGLMLSPLFAFTPDELYLIRRFGSAEPSYSLWESLNRYCEQNPDFERGHSFINTINRYREISEGVKVDAFILRLYHETGLLALAKREGKEENLMLLYNYAGKFEVSSFEGLYNFIKYINEVIAEGSSFCAAESDDTGDAVTIITAHKSKGLEYPIVFIANAETPLVSQMEKRVRVSYSDEYGIAMKTRTDSGLALVENPIHNVIIDTNVERVLEEELRIYYVAMTRARERLFIVGNLKNSSREKYLDSLTVKRIAPSRRSLWELKSLIDIIMLAEPCAEIVFESASKVEKAEPLRELAAPVGELPPDSQAYSLLSERFSFTYPDGHMTSLPEKMSVSRLYPAVLDEMDGEPSLTVDKPSEKNEGRLGILPEFISASPIEESARRGIATHTFLQFFSIESFEHGTPEQELQRLVEKEFISRENAARVRLDEIKLFKSSALFEEMKAAAGLRREFRFSVMLPASLFTEDEEKREKYADSKILLQGVIDCIIEDSEGNLHLIDYKTDRLTKAELADKSLAARMLSEKHSLQLSYYALAIEKIFGKRPKSVRVYSLPLGDTVDIISA